MPPTSRHLARLTDPRWTERRLEILAQRGNDCEACGVRGGIVHVHHGAYEGDRYPWDYRDESLHVLCATCHGKAQALMTRLLHASGELRLNAYVVLVAVAERMLKEQMVAEARERAERGVGGGVMVVSR